MKFANQQSFFDYIKTLTLLASKELGQNFLTNDITARYIVDTLDLNDDEKVLEIGAGFGSLSYFLAQHKNELTLLDVDPKIISFLDEQFGQASNIKIQQESILKHDVRNYQKIIGNLPYYITSDTIQYILLNACSAQRLVFMVQKEVLPRLLADVGQEGYGPFSLLVAYLGRAKRIMSVGRSQFVPKPNVDSAVVAIDILPHRDHKTALKLVRITMDLFHHRRKTIRNNLRLLLKDSKRADDTLLSLGIDGSKRPQDLPLESYLALIKQLKF
ncbi:MAG: 16S rRNA (adenine(1518)-N(6)/adenine(1519)-N(6))-dimethyltransferase RsmA [Bacilli bacterium]